MKRRMVLLLGPNGQLGSDVQRAHAAAGEPFELVPVGRDRVDVGEPGALRRALDGVAFDALINCTGYHQTDEAEDNAALAFRVNAHAVQDMARLCAERGARFLHIGTDYVFGGDEGRAQPLREEAPIAPVNVYGASKALGETLASLACEETLIVRVASLFGVAGASAKGGNFVETMLRLARERDRLRVVDDQIMSPTATMDAAPLLLRMVFSAPAGLYHLVNGGVASWFSFARAILRKAGLQVPIEPCASADLVRRAARPRYSALDNHRVASSFAPPRGWEEALDEYLGSTTTVVPMQRRTLAKP